MTKISIIIPVYNVERYLSKCLDSVVNQTLKDIEIICVNDCSTDNSLTILQEYARNDDRIKIIDLKKNGGLSNARNEGIKQATGTYIGFVDSDDWINCDTYNYATQMMETNDVDLVCWLANIVVDDEYNDKKSLESAKKYHSLRFQGALKFQDAMYKDMQATVWNKLYKTSIIKENNLFFTEGIIYEDEDFLPRYLLFCSNIYFSDKCMYNYLQRTSSIMGRCSSKQLNERIVMLQIFENIYKFYEQYNQVAHHKILLNRILESSIWFAYVRCKNKRMAIREIVNFANRIDNSILQNEKVKLIRKKQLYKISYMISERPIFKKIFMTSEIGCYYYVYILGFRIRIRLRSLENKEKLITLNRKLDKLIEMAGSLQKSLNKEKIDV